MECVEYRNPILASPGLRVAGGIAKEYVQRAVKYLGV
jgi:hypothetical protein